MAKTTYQQHYADGSVKTLRRSARQGRRPLPPGMVKVQITAFVYPATLTLIEQKAREMNMSLSGYIDMAVTLFDISQFPNVENC